MTSVKRCLQNRISIISDKYNYSLIKQQLRLIGKVYTVFQCSHLYNNYKFTLPTQIKLAEVIGNVKLVVSTAKHDLQEGEFARRGCDTYILVNPI